mgnify:CR=1 FL=1
MKSSPPTAEEIAEIVREHKNFANHDILSLQEEVYNSEQDSRGGLAATM